ncbi:MAG: hypothetical protein SNJ53_01345 [Thermodesulfovibrionales bacterium]
MTISATTDILFEISQNTMVMCPFVSDGACKASSLMTLDTERLGKFCGCEDYEDCPIFLAKRLNGGL